MYGEPQEGGGVRPGRLWGEEPSREGETDAMNGRRWSSGKGVGRMRRNVKGGRETGLRGGQSHGSGWRSSAMRSAARALQRAGVPTLGAASKRRVPAIRTRSRSRALCWPVPRQTLLVRGSKMGTGAREAREVAGNLGAAVRGARRRAACTSFRAGPRSAAAASGAERRPGRRPSQRRVRPGSACCRRPLPSRPQQPHSRRGARGRGGAAPAQTPDYPADAHGRGPEGEGKR